MSRISGNLKGLVLKFAFFLTVIWMRVIKNIFDYESNFVWILCFYNEERICYWLMIHIFLIITF